MIFPKTVDVDILHLLGAGVVKQLPDGSYSTEHPVDTTQYDIETGNKAKAAKIVQIETDRNAACVANATAHTRQWQADTRSQALLAQAITLASAGVPLPLEWRDADNSNMPVTSLADLLAIAGAIAVQVQAAYSASWARKAAVEAATTVEEVAAA
jgi:hypothetical protein